MWGSGVIGKCLGNVLLSSSVGFPSYAWVVCKCPGVGSSCRNDVSVSICRGDGERASRADGFVNGLDKGLWIYLNTNLER